jgi:hypothetical protein
MPSGDRVGVTEADGEVCGVAEGDVDGLTVGVGAGADVVGAASVGDAVVGDADTAGLETTGALVDVPLEPQPASASPASVTRTVGTSNAGTLPGFGVESRLPLCFTSHPSPPPRYEFRSPTVARFTAHTVAAWRSSRD